MKFNEKTAVVIGCGVIGACTAWQLLKQGVKHVTLIDESEVPRPKGGASVDGGRSIRYSYGAEEGYTIMIPDAFDSWAELFEDLGKVYYTETGMLNIQTSQEVSSPTFRDTYVMDSYRTLKKHEEKLGTQYKYLNKDEIQEYHPFLKCDDIEFALYLPKAGVLHAADIVQSTFEWVSKQHNATVLCGPEYEVIKFESKRQSNENTDNNIIEENFCTLKNGQTISSDIMIFAINCFTSKLFPEVLENGTLTPSREELVYFMPPDDEIEAWKKCPLLLEKSGEESFYYLPNVGGTGTYGIKASTHIMENTNFDFFTENFEPYPGFKDPIVKWVQNRFSNRGDKSPLQPNHIKVCYYDVSPEERFQVYYLNDSKTAMSLYGFSGHGFKFGSVIGKAISLAVSGQKSPENIQKWLAGLTTLSLKEVQ